MSRLCVLLVGEVFVETFTYPHTHTWTARKSQDYTQGKWALCTSVRLVFSIRQLFCKPPFQVHTFPQLSILWNLFRFNFQKCTTVLHFRIESIANTHTHTHSAQTWTKRKQRRSQTSLSYATHKLSPVSPIICNKQEAIYTCIFYNNASGSHAA